MLEQNSQLDAEELLHLAIKASRHNQTEQAILYLKHLLQQQPNHARALYFLGAQHAEIGLYDRAVEDMSKAVELDPSIDTAHFQLGLLHATSLRPKQAEQAWSALDKLDHQHPLYLFKTGLVHLMQDEFDSAADYLQRGIEANDFIEGLNRDMQRILDDVRKHESGSAQATAHDTTAENAETADLENGKTGNHIFLSAYNNDEDDDKKH